jgi:TonB family protein
LEREYYESVRNLASNEEGQLNAGVRDAQGTEADKIYDEARALEQRMRANRQDYEQGLQEAEGILNNRPAAPAGNNAPAASARSEGNVSISYSLAGRHAVDLYRPTYLCRGGGDVVVRIAVDRNGRVVDAAVDAASADDACLKEYAVKAALTSRFNTDGTAEPRQSGTITYRFAAQ